MAIVLCICPGLALADGAEVTSNDLINEAGEYNGAEIVYTGEVIGDILTRGDHAWINVFDGSNAIGVWVESSDANTINILGGYTAHGDTVRITGVFNRACPEHGGDMDIHAKSVEGVQAGYAVTHDVSAWKLIAAAVLFAGAAVCGVLVLRRRL